MSFEVEIPNSMAAGGGGFKPKERVVLHLGVLAVDENPVSKGDGGLLNGVQISVEVMAGPFARQECDLMLWNEKPTDKNNGEMAKRRKSRWADAVNILPRRELKPGEKVQINLQDAVGQQFIAVVEPDEKTGFPKLPFADIWHIDDPSAPPCERSQDALKMLPKELRRSPESFAKSDSKPAGGKPSGNGNGSGSAAATAAAPPVTAGAAMSADELLS